MTPQEKKLQDKMDYIILILIIYALMNSVFIGYLFAQIQNMQQCG